MGKVLTEARSLQRKLMPDTEDRDNHEQTSLRGTAYKAMMSILLWTARASVTEEPREGKLHAGICAGDAG